MGVRHGVIQGDWPVAGLGLADRQDVLAVIAVEAGPGDRALAQPEVGHAGERAGQDPVLAKPDTLFVAVRHEQGFDPGLAEMRRHPPARATAPRFRETALGAAPGVAFRALRGYTQ